MAIKEDQPVAPNDANFSMNYHGLATASPGLITASNLQPEAVSTEKALSEKSAKHRPLRRSLSMQHREQNKVRNSLIIDMV